MRAKCSHCVRVSTARELGVSGLQELIAQFYVKPDNLAIRYGMRFEEALEQELLANLSDKVKMPQERTLDATLELMNEGVPVIYQGVLQGGSGAMAFSGRPDFLLRSDFRFEFGSSGLTARQVDGCRTTSAREREHVVRRPDRDLAHEGDHDCPHAVNPVGGVR